MPAGQLFSILEVSSEYPGMVRTYGGWLRIYLDVQSHGRVKALNVDILNRDDDHSTLFIIGGAGRIDDAGPLGITFIETPNQAWLPGSAEPKFCTVFHSVGRGSPAGKACPEMSRGSCYGWILEQIEDTVVDAMPFDSVLNLLKNTTKRPLRMRLRPPLYINVPVKPLLSEDGSEIKPSDRATECDHGRLVKSERGIHRLLSQCDDKG